MTNKKWYHRDQEISTERQFVFYIITVVEHNNWRLLICVYRRVLSNFAFYIFLLSVIARKTL